MKPNFPESWISTGFLTVFDIQGGTQPPKSEFIYEAKTGYVQLLQIRDFGERTVPTYIPDTTKLKKCNESDLLIARYGASLGRILTGMSGAFNVAMAKVSVPVQFNRRYAYYLLRSESFQAPLRMVSRSAQNGFNKEDLAGFQVPIAPVPEQKRIADKLDTVLTRVDAVNTRLARVAPLLKRFRQSVLAAATSGRLTNPSENVQKITPIVLRESECKELPKGWAWRQLTSLARLESGHTPRKSVESYWAGGDVPWISLQDIREADGKVIFDTKFHPTNDGIANSSARLLPVGTVCFCRDISFGYVTVMGKEMATSQHFANWVCGSELLPIYLMYAFIAARDSLAMSGQGSTVTTIYMPALKALKIAVPPIHEQTEIVRRVDTLFAFADRLEARLAQAQTAATRLTPALLAKAFRGELVPQDPNDEPAAELLRRLQAERASAPKASTGRGRKAAVQV